jgi:hypothetical protein
MEGSSIGIIAALRPTDTSFTTTAGTGTPLPKAPTLC